MIKAASKGLIKSLALSAAVLGPGLIMVANGLLIPGMIWLFAGSFAMMAWTYRKPWRLMWITGLLPPLAAVVSYLVQLTFFGRQIPPGWLLLAAVAGGVIVGYGRARVHKVYEKDGSVFAQRTVGYLLIWAVAYAATQLLGLVSKQVVLVQSGLVTGAFTTAMLSIVSVMILYQYTAAKRTLNNIPAMLLLTAAILLPAFTGSVDSAAAATTYPDQVFNSVIRKNDPLCCYKGQSISQAEADQVRNDYTPNLGFKISAAFRSYQGKGTMVTIALISTENQRQTLMALKDLEASFAPEIAELLRVPAVKSRKRRSIPRFHNATLQTFWGDANESSAAASLLFLFKDRWGLVIQLAGEDASGNRRAIVGEQEKFVIALADQFVQRIPSLGNPAASGGRGPTDGERPRTGSDRPTSMDEDGGYPPEDTVFPDPEEAAATVAAIAAILIAAGIVIQITNSIAAALAQAVQAGVEFTTEEISAAISQGLEQAAVPPSEPPEEPPPKPKGPTLYDKEGEAFARDEQGQYWAPNRNGDWVWMNENGARQASAALRKESAQRAQEQQHHDSETRRILEKARRELRDNPQAPSTEPGNRMESEPEAENRQRQKEAQKTAQAKLDELLGRKPVPAVPSSGPPSTPIEPDPVAPKPLDPGRWPTAAPNDAVPGVEPAPPENLDALEKQAAEEARRKLDKLLGGEPSDPAEKSSGDGNPADQKTPADPTAKKKDKKPAIAAVPHALSDDRELPQDAPPGPKGEASAAETTPEGKETGSQDPTLATTKEAGTQGPDSDPTTGEPKPVEASEPSETSPAGMPEAGKLVDPVTGEALKIDPDGRVTYGEQSLTPDEARKKVEIDRQWHAAQVEGSRKLDHFKQTVERLENTTDPAVRQRLEDDLVRQLSELNSDYAVKTMLKAEGRNKFTAAFDRAVHTIYEGVDPQVVQEWNDQGYKRGDRSFKPEDLKEFRNAASAGTPGIDRDVGLDQTEYREALVRASQAKAGSPEAHEATRVLAEARRQGKITLDPDQHGRYLDNQRQQTVEKAVDLRGRLATLHTGSPEAVQVRKELDGLEAEVKALDQRRADLDQTVQRAAQLKSAKIEALEQQRAVMEDGPAARRLDRRIEQLRARTDIDVSSSQWNDMAQRTYNEKYAGATGQSAEGAMQMVTQAKHPEAFGDPTVLKGISADNPPDPRYAEQTASVPRVKEVENRHLAGEGYLTDGQAIQETARGYAKDMATKVVPLLENDPQVKGEHLDRMRRMHKVLDKIGKGQIPPGQADGLLQKAVPEIKGLTLAKATRIIDANFESAIKWKKPIPQGDVIRSDVGGRLSTLLDAEQVSQDFNRLIAAGASPEDAAFVASAKALAGAKMGAIYNPGVSMAGALLPEGARGVIPDQFAGELIENGHKAFKGLVEDIAASTVTGKVDFEKFNAAARKIGDGKGVMADWMKAAKFLGEETARAEQSNPGGNALETGAAVLGNLKDDLKRMHETGALGDQARIMKGQAGKYIRDDLAPKALSGHHGTSLQGYAQAAKLAGEIVEDPVEFGRDLKRMWDHGGDAELIKEVIVHTDKTLTNTPAVGVVYGGWKHIGDALTKSEIRGQLSEGAQALATEAKDWLNSSAVSLARSIYKRF